MVLELDRVRQEEFSAAIQNSYAEYGVSSNARAIPDARDGLKPVQRRILWFMYRMGWNATHETVKSAEVVGTVMGQAHPHSDAAIYDAAVRLAQDFSLRYPLIDGQGNFGSDDDDPAASMRYTEMRLSRIGELMLRDIGKDTVALVPTYKQDPKVVEPYYLPARLPPAVNGQDGVGLGFATRVPSHNLREMIAACVALLDAPAGHLTTDQLLGYVQGPDFPGGGAIVGKDGIRDYLETGRGRIIHRGSVRLEEDQRGRRLIVCETPFVGRATVKTSIAKAYNDGKLPGFLFEGHIPDESSDQNGTRIVLPIKKETQPTEALQSLFQHTSVQCSFPVQMTFLFGSENEPARTPRTMGMVELLRRYNEHQLTVLRRRSEYDLARAEERLHIVDGLIIGAVHADEIVKIFQAAPDRQGARGQLMARFKLSEVQAQRISDMTLAQVTRMDLAGYRREKKDLQAEIAHLRDLLAHPPKMIALLKSEMLQIATDFGDERRTTILTEASASEPVAEVQSTIESKPVLVGLTADGGLKLIAANAYAGKTNAGTVRGDDRLQAIVRGHTTDYVLCALSTGRVSAIRAAKLPLVTRAAKSEPARTFLSLQPGERIVSPVAVNAYSEEIYLIQATAEGRIKKTPLSEYVRVDEKGVSDFRLSGSDTVLRSFLSLGGGDYLLAASDGKVVRFSDADLRATGRGGQGVQGIALSKRARVVGAEWIVENDERSLWTAASNGSVKRTGLGEYARKGRSTAGVSAMQLPGHAHMVSAAILAPGENLLLITQKGGVERAAAERVPVQRRENKGQTILHTDLDDPVIRAVVLPA